MGFNFPNTPTQGDLFTPAGGFQYVYDGGVWRIVTTPTQLATAEARNRIVNGAMQISQELGDGVFYQFGYAADQWMMQSSLASVAGKRELPNEIPNGPTPYGSNYRLLAVPTVAVPSPAAGDYIMVFQLIEGVRVVDFMWGKASARQVVLRFGCRAPAGTYSVSLINTPETHSFVAMFTITAGQANTDTYHTVVIPAPPVGSSWNTINVASIVLQFMFAAGSTFTGGVAGWQAGNSKYATSAISNGFAVANASFYIFDVGLYLDPNATGTPPPWQMPDEAQELLACMRYWIGDRVFTDACGYSPVTYGTGDRRTFITFPVPMRIAPAGTAQMSNVGALNVLTHLTNAQTWGTAGGDVECNIQGAIFNARM